MPTPSLDDLRNSRPTDRDDLWNWVKLYTGISIARQSVCKGHQAPFDAFADQCLDRPPQTLTLGSRGSGKSFTAALGLHYDSRFIPGHEARILGGSKDQSRQIYQALQRHVRDGKGRAGSDGDTLESLLVERAKYRNGSEVSILAASSTSVRGPHVPRLKLDEVDEIEPDIREAAVGMRQSRPGMSGAIDMTSTWHRPSGPMADLVERGRAGEFPFYTYCAFEVLERCPVERSGPNLERCPECPIRQWCHEDRLNDPSRPPKAKISDGHYAIEDLISSARMTSKRVFEADYLCKGPKADGLWFPGFDEAIHVDAIRAEFDPAYPVRLAIDSGNRTGAVWFQIRKRYGEDDVAVFADYYSDGASAASDALAIIARCESLANGRRDVIATDPAGYSRTSVGPSVIAEYERAGLKGLQRWPVRPVPDSLALLESFVADATGKPWLAIHPRCKHTIAAFQSYRRGGKAPQWSEMPLDPQHPAEDMIDALRGGLQHAYPDGRKPKFKGSSRTAGGLMY